MENQFSPDYIWWVDYKGVWELRQAANLYLGFDPDRGGLFDGLDELLTRHDQGLILTDSETVWSVRALKKPEPRVEWDDILDKDGNSKVSLEIFVKDKVRVGEIIAIPDDDDFPPGIYFKPAEIILLFHKHFLNKPPQELLYLLALNVPQRKKAQPIALSALNAAYKKYVSDNKERGMIPSWEEDLIAMEVILGKKPTQTQIKTVRAEFAPRHWKQRGRPKKA